MTGGRAHQGHHRAAGPARTLSVTTPPTILVLVASEHPHANNLQPALTGRGAHRARLRGGS